MDLKNFEATSTYAIEAVYRDYWFQIPEKYRLLEKAQRQPDETPKKSSPLTYAGVEKKEQPTQSEYELYCDKLNDKNCYFDLQPFFDPQLDFENRLHYKLTSVNYPDRKGPWFIITWNCGNGLLKSTLTNRRFDTAQVETPSGDKVKFDFINSEMDLTLCFTSNTLQGLFELQEHIRIDRREKHVVNTRKHSIIGEFPVSLDTIDAAISKLDRTKSTLCTLTLTLKIDYPVIGNVQTAETGIIKEIHAEIDEDGAGEDMRTVIARDIITES